MENLSFFLKGVDPLQVAKDYVNKTLRFPTEKIKAPPPTLTQDLVVGNSHDDEVYEHTDKNGTKIRIITGNHNNWVSEGIDKDKFRCNWCRIEYLVSKKDVQAENSRLPLLLPVKIERDDNILYFHGTGEYCCFGCAYAHLKTKTHTAIYYKESSYCDAETILRHMHYLFTGKETLVASPDWEKHVKNGGKLSDKDYYSSDHVYALIPGIIFRPAKVSYIRVEK